MKLKFIREGLVVKEYENDNYKLFVFFPFRDDLSSLSITAKSKIPFLYPDIEIYSKESIFISPSSSTISYERIELFSMWQKAIKELVEDVRENYEEIINYTKKGL